MADGCSDVLASALPAPVERVALFLAEAGHLPEHAIAMAGNLLGDRRAPEEARRWRHLTMTPHEREQLAHTLQARRVLAEGLLMSLDSDDVRDGAILSAHALCEARQARRPLTLQIGGARATLEQIKAARTRLQREVSSLDDVIEAAVATDELSRNDRSAKADPRVVHLQNRLNSLGYRVQPDGIFGPIVEENVKDLQAKAGLDATGVVDHATRDALRNGGRPSWAVNAPPGLMPGEVQPAPLDPAAAGQGDVNKEVGNPASQTAGPTATPGGAQGNKPEPADGVKQKKSKRQVRVSVDLGEADMERLERRLAEARAERARAAKDGNGSAVRVADAKVAALEEAIGPIKKGAFHAWLGKDPDEPISEEDIQKGLAAGGHPAKMAQFARSAKKFHHKKRAEEADSKADYPRSQMPSSCPVCGAPMREGKGVCQRGHSVKRLAEATLTLMHKEGLLG